ncbi:hypothetical protein E4T44_05359 [Aureobasidium sp. EXF-8845]|nr:hypothetical protein E4T44_05359 [Aureobasidium sp. EXF-8845]KAI4853588.1 hypothetical protein E4T45_04274 [Aureobasidium sp. EXF-8846]
MDPDVFEQWRKEQQARIDEKIANGEEIHVPLHNRFWSDGRADKVPGTKSDLTRQEDTTDYLKLLSEKYSKFYEVNLVFTSLPINYTVWKQNPPRSDLYLYGHPRGRFPSTDQFVYHVWYLLNNKIAKCDCRLCEGKVRGYGKGKDKA